MDTKNLKKYAPTVLRLGLVFVFLWFGINQLISQSMWLSLIPKSVISLTGLSAKTLVICNGIFEVVMATLLAFGIRIRIVASLLFLHMFGIIGSLGMNAIAIRDIGLMFALLSVAFQGADEYSVDIEK